MPDIYDRMGDAMRWLYDRRIAAPPILNIERHFPNARLFTANWQAIRDEALAVRGKLERVPLFHEIMKAQKPISDNDGREWRMFVMKAYGAEIRGNLQSCPTMASILARCPEVLSASFSFLAPGKHVPVHRGPFRGVMRFHVGLAMPRTADGRLGATLWVNGTPHLLDNGDCLLWDDTYPHEVMNATDELRIALLLDVWRPNMPADMAVLSRLVVAGAWATVHLRKHFLPPSAVNVLQ